MSKSNENLSINEEAGLGSNWVPVDAPPIVPGQTPPGTPINRTPTNLQGSLPPGFQHDTSFVATEIDSPSVPKFSIMPLGIQGNPMTNSAIQSTAIKSMQSSAASTPIDVEEIAVNKQSGTSYTVQDSDNDTLISMSNNAGGTVSLPSGLSGGSSSPLAFVQEANAYGQTFPGQAQASNTITITADNTVVVLAAGTRLDSVTDMPVVSVQDNLGNIYTLLKNVVVFATGAGQRYNASLWVSTNVIGGVATITSTGTNYGAGFSFVIQEVLEYTPSSVFLIDGEVDKQGSAVGSWTATTPAFLTRANIDLLLAFVINQTTNADWRPLTFGAGYTQRGTPYWSNATDFAFGVADKKTTSAGLYTASVATTGGNAGVLSLFAVQLTGVSSILLPAGFYCWVENTGTGTFVVGSAAQIDGANQTVSLGQNQGALFVFDGFNWYTERGIGVATPVTASNGGTGRTSLTAHNVLLGEGTSPIGFAPPVSAGFVLTDNGVGFDPTFQVSTGGLPIVVKVNGNKVSTDKHFYIDGISDGAPAWGVNINGSPDGG